MYSRRRGGNGSWLSILIYSHRRVVTRRGERGIEKRDGEKENEGFDRIRSVWVVTDGAMAFWVVFFERTARALPKFY